MGDGSGQSMRLVLVGAELGSHGTIEALEGCEVSVVRGVLAGLAPHHLDGVKLGTIGWQRVEPEPALQSTLGSPDAAGLLIRDVVED